MKFSIIFNTASAWLCTPVPVQALTVPASHSDHPLVARDLVNSDTLPQRSRYWHKEKEFNPKWEWQPRGNKKSLGRGLFAYVLDFGIDGSHPELAGRVWFPEGANFVGGGDGDKNGHGTQIAGVIAGVSVGLVPGADIISVKIGTDDSNQFYLVLEGLEWSINHIIENNRIDESVIHVSCAYYAGREKTMGGKDAGYSARIVDQVTRAREIGIPVFVPSGNQCRKLFKAKVDPGDGEDGGRTAVKGGLNMPSQLKEVITVGGATYDMDIDPKTNYGSLVNILAAGEKDSLVAANFNYREGTQPRSLDNVKYYNFGPGRENEAVDCGAGSTTRLTCGGGSSAATASVSAGELYLQSQKKLKGEARIKRLLSMAENENVGLREGEKTHKRYLFLGDESLLSKAMDGLSVS